MLFEGLNFGGKTTTTGRVYELLEARGDRVERRRCHITKSEITDSLEVAARQAVQDGTSRVFPNPDLLRPFHVLKSAQMIVDAEAAATSPYASDDGPILVQDRHWLSVFCGNEFFNPGEGYLSQQWRAQCTPRFTAQIYLTCSPAERKRRSLSRDGDAHGLNAYFRTNLDQLDRFDSFCRESIADDPTWLILSTDGLSPDEVAAAAVAEFDRAASSVRSAAI
ncbi:hypothetical protein [Micromonospora sp. NPDC093244]|uniref:hypothetical protein n=1 Tax=Micromonospora sp. NPDC093244 TaxID=3155071 RepID=UPI003444C231